MGGLFAVAGASLAFIAARFAARVSRQGAARQEWWDRAEWALNRAISDKGTERQVGLRTLELLAVEATPAEAGTIDAVTTVVLEARPVDANVETPHNGGRPREWGPWHRSDATDAQ